MSLSDVRRAHEMMDLVMAKVLAEGTDPDGNKVTLPCCRGCSACCYEPVYADRSEAELAVAALSQLSRNVRKDVRERVKAVLETVKASGLLKEEQPSAFEYRKLRVPCPFLDLTNGECRIYKNRPIGCRSHIALKPRDWCEDDEKRKKQQFMVNPEFTWPATQEIAVANRELVMDHFILLLAEVMEIEEVWSEARMKIMVEDDDER